MSPQKYSELKQNDNSASSPEISLIEDGQDETQSWRTLQSWRWSLLLIATVTLLTGLYITVQYLLFKTQYSCDGLPSQAPFFPKFPMTTTTFESGGVFSDTGEVGDQAWNDLVPVGAGYLRIPYPRRYDLPSSVHITNDTEKAEVFQASVIHQIHCLAYFRAYFITHERGEDLNQSYSHMIHCINYVRQAILCTGDTTLEGSNEKGTFNGNGAMHQCRDWDFVTNFLIENRANDFQRSILHT